MSSSGNVWVVLRIQQICNTTRHKFPIYRLFRISNRSHRGNNGVIRVYYNEDEQVKKVVWKSTDIYEYDEIINFGKSVLDFYDEKYGDYTYDDYKKVITWEETNTGYRYSLYINGTETGGNDKNWLEITYE